MGKPVSEVLLEAIREEALPDAKFEVPGGYKLQDPFAAR
jgi:hypothetical protein